MLIELERFAYSPDGTFGRLRLGGLELWTCERPWKANAPFESCIPEGVYDLQLRPSPLIDRITKGEYRRGWEVCDVPGRSHILIHPANWPDELEGCIAPGLRYAVLNGKNAVASSLPAFRKLMAAIPEGENELRVYQCRPEYP